jgi:putative transposase
MAHNNRSVAKMFEAHENAIHINRMLYHLRRPARGVLEDEKLPTLVFATICSRKRTPWLATPQVHRAVRSAWLRHKRWLVSAYVVMPDHVHFFAEPGAEPASFDDWITSWRRGVGRLLKNPDWRWQAGSFHHRIRCFEDAVAKRIYMDENLVRAGLVKRIRDWPYRGELVKTERWWF